MLKFERIILVDDDALTLKYNELIIEQSGFKGEVISLDSSKQAMNLYEKTALKNSLMLIDMNLENENALEFLEVINKLPLYLPKEHDVYILSSAVLIDFVKISKTFPEVKKYLEKPLVLEALNRL